MEAWSGAESVILVDAVVTGGPPGTVHAWDGRDLKACRTFSASTHGLGVGEAIELGRTLGQLPAKIQIYGIEATQVAPGTTASPEVEQAAGAVAREIARLAESA